MRNAYLFCLVCLGLCSTQVQAADENNQFALKGAGFLPCQVYSQERQKKSNIYYMVSGWLEGYLSAHNQYTENTYDIASFESLELLLGVLEKHCQSNPGDRLYGVMASIVSQLHPQRLAQESNKIEISDGSRKTQLYRETVRRMQQRLEQLGLFKAPIDGRYTDATRSALAAFQSDLNFETTGFPDQTTLWRLFRS